MLPSTKEVLPIVEHCTGNVWGLIFVLHVVHSLRGQSRPWVPLTALRLGHAIGPFFETWRASCWKALGSGRAIEAGIADKRTQREMMENFISIDLRIGVGLECLLILG